LRDVCADCGRRARRLRAQVAQSLREKNVVFFGAARAFFLLFRGILRIFALVKRSARCGGLEVKSEE